MKRIIFLITILLFVSLSNIFAQQPLAAYDTSGRKIWVRVDANGYLIPSGGGATEIKNSTGSNLFEGTNPGLVTPYNPSYTWVDSLAHSGGAHVDTTTFSPNGAYSILTLFIKARASADTLTIKMKSTASALVWGISAFGLKDVGSSNYGNVETDNATVIITANVNRRLQITIPRGQYILVCRKVTNSVNRVNSIKISLEGVNF
jgi:hypothetical protein